MQHVRNYYNSEAQMMRSSFSQPFISRTYKTSFLKPKSKAEIKVLAAKKHSEAEKRRRMRINGQYETLRNILPNIIKVSARHKYQTVYYALDFYWGSFLKMKQTM